MAYDPDAYYGYAHASRLTLSRPVPDILSEDGPLPTETPDPE